MKKMVITTMDFVPQYAIFRYDNKWWRKMTAIYALLLNEQGTDYNLESDDKIFNNELVAYVGRN